ncbi:uncharacterized protein [Palaemon carinicauda]|uniref:uncharacterized protein n=1 Tax=Palaemon carinicauda TaxID=392227 RepID=UPI0035B6694E
MLLLLLVSLFSGALAQSHECERLCLPDDVRTCVYEFRLQEYYTLSRACYDCPDNMTDCSRPECIAADGFRRPLLAINRMLPGPSISVCEGDRVIVDVYNGQLSDVETIHFHGQHMKGYQYSDGAPFATQCPIIVPFRYDFVANNPGTTFWHSHSGLHRAEGIYGAIIVRQVEDPQAGTYDVDVSDHTLIVQDWYHKSSMEVFSGMAHGKTPPLIASILVNGKGWNTYAEKEGLPKYEMPLAVVNMKKGLRHRVRLIQAGGACPILVSVDNHKMTVIASDAQNIEPLTVSSIVMYSGERFDVVIETDQEVDNYWIRFTGILDCQHTQTVQGAILRYEGAPEELPKETLVYNPDYPAGIVLNPFNSIGGPDRLTVMNMTALEPYTVPDVVDKQFYLAFDFKEVNDTSLYNEEYYPYSAVDRSWQVKTPQINGITFAFPHSPPMSQPEEPQPTICVHGNDISRFCKGDFCSCTYVFNVGLGETVELILIDEGTFGVDNHPFHLHGYSFSVVAMGKVGEKTTAEEVATLDAQGLIERRLESPALKDTVNIVDGGYTIVRLKADNPGYWLMHCHLILHSEAGMIAILHVGEQSDLPPVPEGFPTCKAFLPEI